MGRKRGELPGRYVLPYVRRSAHRPGEYDEVGEYQEWIEPAPSPQDVAPRQLELSFDPDDDEKEN
jgi:hypothetical protein